MQILCGTYWELLPQLKNLMKKDSNDGFYLRLCDDRFYCCQKLFSKNLGFCVCLILIKQYLDQPETTSCPAAIYANAVYLLSSFPVLTSTILCIWYISAISQLHQTKLECHDRRQFNYIFYVDFEASVAEIPAQNALKELEVSVLSSASHKWVMLRFISSET